MIKPLILSYNFCGYPSQVYLHLQEIKSKLLTSIANALELSDTFGGTWVKKILQYHDREKKN